MRPDAGRHRAPSSVPAGVHKFGQPAIGPGLDGGTDPMSPFREVDHGAHPATCTGCVDQGTTQMDDRGEDLRIDGRLYVLHASLSGTAHCSVKPSGQVP